MRKFVNVMIAAAIAGSLAGCGAKTDSETTAVQTAEAETTTMETGSDEQTSAVQTDEATEASDGTDGQMAVDEKLSQIHQAVKDAYEEYIPSAPYDQAALADMFGVSTDLYDSYIAEGPMISVHVETFVGIAAKEGKGVEVEDALNEYRDNLLAESIQYPMNIAKVQASQVVRHGDYVFFVMLGAPTMEAQEQGEDAALASAQENNQLAVTAISGFFKEQ